MHSNALILLRKLFYDLYKTVYDSVIGAGAIWELKFVNGNPNLLKKSCIVQRLIQANNTLDAELPENRNDLAWRLTGVIWAES